MKKQYLIKKIISIFFIVLLLILTPITGFMNGKSAFVYAANLDIMQGASEISALVAGYLAYQYNNASNTINSIDLASAIDTVKQSIPNVYPKLSNESKFIIASLTTTLRVQDINYALGTNYSDTTISGFGIDTLRLKIENNEPLTLWDMQKLGINDMTAFNIKDGLEVNKRLYDSSTYYEKNGQLYKSMTIGSYMFWARVIPLENNIFNSFPTLVDAKQTWGYSLSYFNVSASYVFQVGSFYRISYSGSVYPGSIDMSKSLEDSTRYLGTQNIDPLDLKFEKSINGTWTVLYSSTNSVVKSTALLNSIKANTGIDLTATTFNDKYLKDIFDYTFTGNGIRYGNPDKPFTATAPTFGLIRDYTGEDTSQLQAEKVKENIDAQAVPIPLDYQVKAYENNDTNQKEITLIPQADGVPYSDTGANATDYPDTTGDTNVNPDTGQGSINIPILGTLLLWLQKIWQALRDILQTLFDGFNKPGTLDEGIDWGNFKGLFDIFYIFYYLIIIVIMILLKFLAVVFNMLSIPANSSLFANYPTMLSGLNYIKNIKVGGFNITLQQIFEYMFTVFFFLFIVTTLQKLYHSFAGIERQTINQEQKWDSNSNVIYRDGNYINTKTGEIQDYKYK